MQAADAGEPVSDYEAGNGEADFLVEVNIQ